MALFKNLLFYLIALIGVPAAFFIIVEQGLKFAGIGAPQDFFKILNINGQAYYQDNPAFIHQFYPASLGITPIENTFSALPDDQTIRVFILGGSAARGFPNLNHGFSRHLEILLEQALPTKKIDVINTAMTSVNSHVIYDVAKSIPAGPSTFAIILVGNNEVVGPYGPGTFNQTFLANLSIIRLIQAIKRTRVWQAANVLVGNLNPKNDKETLRWRGMQMFTDNNVAFDDPRLETVYEHYENNLFDTVSRLQDKGIHVLLSSVPVNLRDSAPFSSQHPPGLSDDALNTLNRQHQYSAARFKDQRFQDAVNALNAAKAIAPNHADTHYQLGIAYEKLGQNAESAEHFQQALDLDTLRFRADTQINARIRRVAEQFNDTAFNFVDSETAFKRASQPKQPGWNLLLEHVHYSFEGNYLLAAGFAEAILETVDASSQSALLPAQEIAHRIGYPNFTTIDAMGRLLDMVQTPPFTGQSNYVALVDFINGTGAARAKQVGSTQDVIKRRKALVATGRADWQIHYELAELFRHEQDPESALHHFRQVIQEYPHHGSSHLKLAEIHQAFGRFKAAIPHLEQALNYTRDDHTLQAQTLGALASAQLKAGDPSQAKRRLLELIDAHPGEIELTLKAYGTLVKRAVEEGAARDVNQHLRDLEDYAQALVRSNQLEQYPLLPRRMAQILSLAGRHAEARQWAQLQSKPAES